ncbi:MAG: CotH kinase family protein [Mobilitalea sp.]
MQRKRIGALIAVSTAVMILLSACDTNTGDVTTGDISSIDVNTGDVTTEKVLTENLATKSSYANEIDKIDIISFEIYVDETNWQTMLDNAINEEYISADVTINGTTIKNVGIRPKGNSSLSQVAKDDTTDRYSFKIKFDEYVEGQTWEGLDKIVINNMFSDATYMKEYLSYDIMSYIGVEVPLFAFADIAVNGETWGLYLAVEDIDSGYLERVFNSEGELYKPDNDMQLELQNNGGEQGNNKNEDNFPDRQFDSQFGGMGGMVSMAQNGVSLQYTDDKVSSYSAIFDNAVTDAEESDYQRVITALKNLNNGTDLETNVDVEEVLKYFAAQTVVVNLDSYVSNMGHNYYLYEKDGQLSILPWDYNLAFGGFQSGSVSEVVNFPIDTPISGVSLEERPLLGKLIEVPEYFEKYHEYLQEIVNGYFDDGKFEQKVDTLNNLISEYVKNDPSAFYTYEEYQISVVELKELGVLRAESIQGQLDGTIPSTTEGQEKDSSALIDASAVDLTSMGTQGGDKGGQTPMGNGMGQGKNSNFAMLEGLDRDTIEDAFEIIRDTQDGELTEIQQKKLSDLVSPTNRSISYFRYLVKDNKDYKDYNDLKANRNSNMFLMQNGYPPIFCLS